jgi:PKD repeat protein
VPNKPPIASFTYLPLNPHVGDSILFNASTSYDPDGFIASYNWDFGDGNTTRVSDSIIYYHYEIPGAYNVTLTVVDSGELKNATSKEVTITKPPLAAFIYLPLRPRVGQTIVFNASESKPNGGYIVSYFWDFGDNVTETTGDPIVTHFYTAFGSYSVALTIMDSEGETAMAEARITVIAPPKADFIFEPSQPRACDVITFNALNSDPNGGFIVEFEWCFGDGSEFEFGMIVQHKYAKMGEYAVSLNVTDSEGEWNMKEITLEVLPHRADLNEDGKVDILDLHVLCSAYGSYPGHERWNAKADINHDGKVNILDAVIIARSFHQCGTE